MKISASISRTCILLTNVKFNKTRNCNLKNSSVFIYQHPIRETFDVLLTCILVLKWGHLGYLWNSVTICDFLATTFLSLQMENSFCFSSYFGFFVITSHFNLARLLPLIGVKLRQMVCSVHWPFFSAIMFIYQNAFIKLLMNYMSHNISDTQIKSLCICLNFVEIWLQIYFLDTTK